MAQVGDKRWCCRDKSGKFRTFNKQRLAYDFVEKHALEGANLEDAVWKQILEEDGRWHTKRDRR